MRRLVVVITVLAVQLTITSCSGYGIIYDDKRLQSTENEQNCLEQPSTECLLETAAGITAEMSDDIAHAEAQTVLAKTRFELGNNQAALNDITNIRIISMQFSALLKLSHLAKKQARSSDEILLTADSITLNAQRPQDKIASLLLSAILSFENQDHQSANRYLQQAIELVKQSTTKQINTLDLRFFKNLIPKLHQFNASGTIEQLIELQIKASWRISAQAEYLLLLKQHGVLKSEHEVEKLVAAWQSLEDEHQQKLSQASIIKLLVGFNKLKQARKIKNQQLNLVAKTTVSAIIVNQLTAQANISAAKLELVGLLRDIRTQAKSDISSNKQQAAQDEFTLDNLRAQAIADIALALSDQHKMTEAVHFAEQIQIRMAHIQGYTLTKLAMKYVIAGDVNAGLLTMESIYRAVNRAACLAQISAEVAKKGNREDLNRAIVIAARINRQSWLDIANSEISITQAQLNDMDSAMKTINSIQRSFSAVYAMSEIARTLQASQNKR